MSVLKYLFTYLVEVPVAIVTDVPTTTIALSSVAFALAVQNVYAGVALFFALHVSVLTAVKCANAVSGPHRQLARIRLAELQQAHPLAGAAETEPTAE